MKQNNEGKTKNENRILKLNIACLSAECVVQFDWNHFEIDPKICCTSSVTHFYIPNATNLLKIVYFFYPHHSRAIRVMCHLIHLCAFLITFIWIHVALAPNLTKEQLYSVHIESQIYPQHALLHHLILISYSEQQHYGHTNPFIMLSQNATPNQAASFEHSVFFFVFSMK